MKRNGRFRLFVWLSLGLLVIDQLVKLWARVAASGVEGRSLVALWPNVFELKLVYNEGVAFGMMQGMGVLLTPVALAIAIGAGVYSFRHPKDPLGTHVTTALLASGAIGNLIDRLALGHVTDMFWFRLIDFPVFNVADICITFAAVLLGWEALRDFVSHKEEPPETDRPEA